MHVVLDETCFIPFGCMKLHRYFITLAGKQHQFYHSTVRELEDNAFFRKKAGKIKWKNSGNPVMVGMLIIKLRRIKNN